MEQTILAVDEEGKFIKYIPKPKGHEGVGRRHLAIAVMLENSKGEVLLQKRKHKIFDNIWDITGATHPLHLEEKDETLEEAAWRCLKDEYGITQKIPLKNLGAFKYFSQDGKNCENEYCYLLVGEYNGQVSLNPEAGYEYKWREKGEFIKDIKMNPGKYSPWAKEAIKLLKQLK